MEIQALQEIQAGQELLQLQEYQILLQSNLVQWVHLQQLLLVVDLDRVRLLFRGQGSKLYN
jgi:hypothetical protein